MSYQTIDERLTEAQVALDNTLADPILLDGMSLYKYDATRIAEGQALLAAARAAQDTMQAEYGEQYAATDGFYEVYDTAQKTYNRYRRVARVALRGLRGVDESLSLSGPRKRTISGWLGQTRQFYNNALSDPDILDALNGYNVTTEMLEAGRGEVDMAEASYQARERERGDAHDATVARDAEMEKLDEWMDDFFEIAEVAFEDDAQQLEKLGVVVPA